jgi:hypothetical protein
MAKCAGRSFVFRWTAASAAQLGTQVGFSNSVFCFAFPAAGASTSARKTSTGQRKVDRPGRPVKEAVGISESNNVPTRVPELVIFSRLDKPRFAKQYVKKHNRPENLLSQSFSES